MIHHKNRGMMAAMVIGAVAFALTPAAWADGMHHGGYGQDEGVSAAFIVPLYPQKTADLKKGVPAGMTAASFKAGHGSLVLTRLPGGKVKAKFYFSGLIPNGVYSLWNVFQTHPWKDEPFGGKFGSGIHSVVADAHGFARKTVVLDKWPGIAFSLDYHADGKLSQSKGAYPGALWGDIPSEPKR